MNDLNTVQGTDGQSEWLKLAFWVESVQYWTDRLACYGDTDGRFYQASIDNANNMVTLHLTGNFPE